MSPTYLVLRGDTVLCAPATEAAAMARVAGTHNARVVVRPCGVHPHWRSRAWWRAFDALVARQLA